MAHNEVQTQVCTQTSPLAVHNEVQTQVCTQTSPLGGT